MKVAILGSSGFIGRYLINKIKGSVGVSLRSKDWGSRVENSDVWVNLVGKAHDHNKTATRDDYYRANLELTKLIFNRFAKSRADLLIHISSIAAIEEFESRKPLSEDGICNPTSWYGCSKREAECWLLEQIIPEGKKLIILRPPMVHGEGDKGNLGLLYKIISNGFPYPLAAFNNRRSFISIDNFTYFIQKIAENRSKLLTGIYHIADDENISTKEIIEIIRHVTQRKVVNISIPKFIIKIIAKFGDFIPFPLNSNRLRKMTSDLLVSNCKIKVTLGIEQLPLTAKEGLIKTLKSFK